MHPDFRAVGADAVTITLPDVNGLRNDAVEHEIASVGGRAGSGKLRGIAAKMGPDPAAAVVRTGGGSEPVAGRDQIDRIVGAHEAGNERRRRMMEYFFRSAGLHDAARIDH